MKIVLELSLPVEIQKGKKIQSNDNERVFDPYFHFSLFLGSLVKKKKSMPLSDTES